LDRTQGSSNQRWPVLRLRERVFSCWPRVRTAPYLICAGGIGLALSLGTPAVGQPVSVRTASQESTPPKYFLTNGQASGLCPDVLHALEKQDSNLHFDGLEQFLPTSQIEAGLGNGRIDVFCGMIKLPRREAAFHFLPIPVYSIEHHVAVRIDDPVEVRDLIDLKQKALGSYVITANGFSFVDQLKASGIPVDDSSADNQVNLKKLLGKRGRFLYMSGMLLADLIHREHVEDKVRILPAVLRLEPLYLVTSPQLDPAVTARIAAALQRLDSSGELARIRAPYMQIP